MDKGKIKEVVREGYAKVAKQGLSCCGPTCNTSAEEISKGIGYTEEDMKKVPEGANLGLGCGNPVALASIKEGETVLDLGSGAGFDCFLAADKVGNSGKVIGLDMTQEMVDKATENAKNGNINNVEFRLGEIENMPVDDNSVDLMISNCVINLSPDKPAVFKETHRVLKPGGRFMVSDIVLLKELPEEIKKSVSAYIGCVSGALLKEKYIDTINEAGFKDIEILSETIFPLEFIASDPMAKKMIDRVPKETAEDVMKSIISIRIKGVK